MNKNSGKKVKVTQVVSAIRRREDQTSTLKGLGLKKLHQSRVLEDTPSVRGMIEKIKHLLKIEEVK
ncbi:50S ribosomal protein L30 [Candidatus Nucleicultrix amoebiphila]|jgi:large subunit ribosomal protein L30|uniref:Large ribosomal subunit protein uL30 n=1 Tax=Candidatus Nucleicultrix amoebiphila FS5 TaxID=1414854 RepID=A0A1W6N628_9PROT|nr:50S ribosomal protein L30 [Candidatus Nucleicultrix amoebiphila]ARN85340.1 50S ribosomal protein L30 [Candidatus Nucleicultrix amoebiphila FS5]